MKIARVLSMMAILVLLIGAVVGVAQERGGVLVFARGGDSVRLDPADITDGESVKVCQNVFNTLYEFDLGTSAVHPALATGYEVSEDGLEWTFFLRKGVMFHPWGDNPSYEMTSSDVVFTFQRQYDENHSYHIGDFAYWGYMYNYIIKAEALGDYTVKFTLDRPSAPNLLNLSCFTAMIVSERAMKDMGVEEFRNHPVGTGPFKFVSWTRGSEIVLEAFEDYWNKPYPYLDGVIFKVIPEEGARLMALKAGDIDVMDSVTPDNAPLIEEDANLKLLEAPGLNVGYVAMNQMVEPFDKLLVRLAVNYAVDKKMLVDTFYKGRGEAAVNPMPSNLWGWNDEIVDYPYDPDLAKACLAAAGYPDGFDTELWYMPVFRDYFPQPKLVAQAIQAQLAEVGIRAELVTYEWGTYLEKTEEGEHPMCMLGWMGDNGDPDNFIYVLLDKDSATVGSAGNVAFYISDALHEVNIAAQTIADVDTRIALYKQAQVIIHGDAPWLTVATANRMVGVGNYVHDYDLNPVVKGRCEFVWSSK